LGNTPAVANQLRPFSGKAVALHLSAPLAQPRLRPAFGLMAARSHHMEDGGERVQGLTALAGDASIHPVQLT
jgi:hypothetical protein